MVKVLIVDDELPLLRNLASYLGTFPLEFEVITAPSAEIALESLAQHLDTEILLTDVRLPGIDGIELVSRAVKIMPGLRVMVMTAFPSPERRRHATAVGALRYLEKPIDLAFLRLELLSLAEGQPGWSGSVGGLDIFDFTQLFSMSGKNTAIRVGCGERHGVLGFRDGHLVHACCGDIEGEQAFFDMTIWQGGTFEEIPATQGEALRVNITASTSHLMVEAARLRDEARGDFPDQPDSDHDGVDQDDEFFRALEPATGTTNPKETGKMALMNHLAEFEEIAGFMGVAVFTAQGEMLDGMAKGTIDIKSLGMFANNALLNAQKATEAMGVGRGNLMRIRAPQATVMMRCYNEATDFAATKQGKAHFHTVVVVDPEGSTGMAAMILDKAVIKIADELR